MKLRRMKRGLRVRYLGDTGNVYRVSGGESDCVDGRIISEL
jgi:hypothetical protein